MSRIHLFSKFPTAAITVSNPLSVTSGDLNYSSMSPKIYTRPPHLINVFTVYVTQMCIYCNGYQRKTPNSNSVRVYFVYYTTHCRKKQNYALS